MKVRELFENKDVEKTVLPVDSIAMSLFGQKAGIIKDSKRDKDKKYIGVSHEKSKIKAGNKALFLTFDNSTDSGEFEIDSFTPLKIEKGDDLDKAIKKLFDKHELTRGTGYVVKAEATYLRELTLGKKLGKPAVRFVNDLIKLLKSQDDEVPTEDETDSEEKTASKEKPSSKDKLAPKEKEENPKEEVIKEKPATKEKEEKSK